MNNGSLYSKLIEYGKNGRYGFHMPGHKRRAKLLDGMDPFDIDITEINGFDNLHHAEGIIKKSMENASDFWGTDRTWFLVNGSSCGILAAINAVTDIGDNIVIGRNCHKSVYNATELRDLQVQYLYPEYIDQLGINGGYDYRKLEELFKCNNNIKAVVITSPTYDGIVSDIQRIADVVHENGAVLIVDEAHGAHLGITDKLPEAAYNKEADIVIESIHKTLPSLTQTAMLHLKGNRVSADRIEECLGVYESSSPSYVLMSSIDKCIRELQTSGKQQLENLLITDKKFRKDVDKLKFIRVPGLELKGKHGVFDYDETKLIIHVEPEVCDGKTLSDILRNRYNFEMEMEGTNYVLAITTICDDEKEIARLAESLKEIDKEFEESFNNNVINKRTEQPECDKMNFELLGNECFCSVYEAKRSLMQQIKLSESGGCISGEYLYLYPPGIPLLVPGEVISERFLQQVLEFKKRDMNIQGLKDRDNIYINILKQ